MKPRSSVLILIALLLGALGPVACGDDEDDSTAATGADLARYCQLSRQLDSAGQEIFRKLEQDPTATPEDFRKAEAELVRQEAAALDELTQVAPPEIRQEAAVLVSALHARAGLADQPADEKAAADAEQTVTQFERQNCPKPSDGT